MKSVPGFEQVYSRLIEQGLLLEADSKLPSVTREIVGGPIQGSWWGHSRGQEIYAVSKALHAHGDVLVTKLVNAKITFVHRRQWASLWWIANSGESWQTGDLSPEARKLLTRVGQEGRLEAKGNAVRELERRLLARAVSIHTESGSHAKLVESWEHWRQSVDFKPRSMRLETAKGRLEKIAADWKKQSGAPARLPWS